MRWGTWSRNGFPRVALVTSHLSSSPRLPPYPNPLHNTSSRGSEDLQPDDGQQQSGDGNKNKKEKKAKKAKDPNKIKKEKDPNKIKKEKDPNKKKKKKEKKQNTEESNPQGGDCDMQAGSSSSRVVMEQPGGGQTRGEGQQPPEQPDRTDGQPGSSSDGQPGIRAMAPQDARPIVGIVRSHRRDGRSRVSRVRKGSIGELWLRKR